MSGASRRPPLSLEQAFDLLPELEELAPLRSHVLARSRGGESAGRNHTVGKRRFAPFEMRSHVSQAVAVAQTHLATLYSVVVDAFEARQEGDLGGVVRALLAAGELEEGVGRRSPALEWYRRALRIAEGLRDRRPEIVVLLRLGELLAESEGPEAASRCFQRSLAIAEATLDRVGAAASCRGLGRAALSHGLRQGAASWFRRGLGCGAEDPRLVAQLHLGRSEAALSEGRRAEAHEHLARAQEMFTRAGDGPGIVRVLGVSAKVAWSEGRPIDALARLREALARLPAQDPGSELEITTRVEIARLYAESGRLPDAEDELRRAEDAAILRHSGRDLARIYLELGRLRIRQGDESGFVFFEKSIELLRGAGPAPRLEAETFVEYGIFRRLLGEYEESRAHLEQAREVASADAGHAAIVRRAEEELSMLPTVESSRRIEG